MAIAPQSSFRGIVPQGLLYGCPVLEGNVEGVVQTDEIDVCIGVREM